MNHYLFHSTCLVFAYSFSGMLISIASADFSGFSMEKLFYAQRDTMVRYQEQLAVLGGLDSIRS